MKRISGSRKWIGAMVFAALFVVSFSTVSFADLRIVTDSEGERSEVLMKNSRILTPMEDGSKMIFECRTNEVTIVSNRRYWQGSLNDLRTMLQANIGEVTAEIPQDIGGLLGGLFGGGSNKSETTQVRVTRVGDEKVGDYNTTQYRVETGSGSNWKTHETLWISSELLRDVRAEVGNCYSNVNDLGTLFAEVLPFGLEDKVAVMKDPEYMKLFDQGYPVKTASHFTLFGMSVEVETIVVEVSKAAISEDAFAIPRNYRQVSDPFEVFN